MLGPPTPFEAPHRGWGFRLRQLSAPEILLLSFLGMIAVGTAGYLLLPGLYTGPDLGFVDALFTATSAVCVTGLIVVDTATYFTFWGQLWTILLVQAGGLGILTFTTLVAITLGERSSLRMEEAVGAHAAHLRNAGPADLIRTVMGVTFGLEAIGAVALWAGMRDELGGAAAAVWPAIFHAISAFCNAGFSIFSDSLMGFQRSPDVIGTVALLVIAGGLGFVVLEDVRARFIQRQTRHLSVHSKLVLTTTVLLLAIGWLAFLWFEWGFELRHLEPIHKVANAGFMSVTPRTAGFNSVDYAEITSPSLFLTILLMLMGGSPGSTAGGFKTVTVGVLFLLLLSRLRGEERVSVFNRTIPRETVNRAVSLVVGGLVILGGAVFLLSITELPAVGPRQREAFLRLVFEAHSAFGTVGLSTGATGELTGSGRVVITVLMFLGRVGPVSAVAIMARALRRPTVDFRYGEEDVILG